MSGTSKEKDFWIAFIDPNDFKFESLDVKDIPKYVKFEKVNMDNMMKLVVDKIKPNVNDIGDTMFASHGKDYIVDVFFKQWGSKDGVTAVHELPEIPEKERNMMASRLIIDNVPIAGPAAVFKMEIDKDTLKCKPVDLTWKDVHDILNSRIHHRGVKLLEDSIMEEFAYDDPSKLKGVWVDIELFRYNLQLCFQPTDEEKGYKVNKLATCLAGGRRIDGPVLVLSKHMNSLYGDIEIDELKDLIKCSEGKMKDRVMTKEEMKEGERVDGMLLAVNKYSIIRDRLKKWSKKCNYCQKDKDVKKCTGCFRVYYCSKTCLRDDWRTHKKECHFKTKSLNSVKAVKNENESEK